MDDDPFVRLWRTMQRPRMTGVWMSREQAEELFGEVEIRDAIHFRQIRVEEETGELWLPARFLKEGADRGA